MRTALNEPKNFRAIMLSSTFTDLKRHREQVIKAIREFGYKAEVMEESGARADVDVIDSSLKMVRDSVAYALIIGQKYGQTPVSPKRNPDRLSITELEFNEAMRLKRPILLFIMDKKHPIIEEDIELDPDKRQKLDAFRERAKRMRDGEEVQRVYQTFDSLKQFSTAAAIAIGKLARQLEQHEADEQLSEIPIAARTPTPPRTLSNIPLSIPRHFLGRDEDLAAIDAALERNRGRVAVAALHGLRGVGKTTLAVAYAERHRSNYRAMWWIRAETESTMRADLVGLGVRLGWVAADEKEEPALAAVMERLRNEGDNILLVYDNANNPEEVRKYLPWVGAAQIIVTSNAPNWGAVATRVEIEVWPNEIGGDYLIARTGRDGERDAALALSEALGGLPLAHEQAAAFCERTGISLADYRVRFEAAPAKFLDAEKDASPEYHNRRTVAKTFALAIDEAAKCHPAAEPLIVCAALFAPEPIPLFLFAEASDKFDEPLASDMANGGVDEAIAALRSFALVDREMIPDERDPSITTDCIRLHRLVRQIAATRREGEAREDVVTVLAGTLAEVYPKNTYNDPSAWPKIRRLDAHAMALFGGRILLPQGIEQLQAGVLQELGAYRHYVLGASSQARPLFESALALRERTLGSEHRSTCVSMSYLAILLKDQGDFTAARALFDRVLTITEKMQGSEDPDTAAALNNLGSLLHAQGDLAGARPYYERALVIYEKVRGPQHLDTSMSLNNVGGLLLTMGEFADALPYLKRALTICEKALGPDHIDTARTLVNLGSLLFQLGDFTAASPYAGRALAIYEKMLGSQHPRTRNAARFAASTFDALGSSNEADLLYKKYGIVR
jgi:tetratricopeptide (TPR) repeat protein